MNKESTGQSTRGRGPGTAAVIAASILIALAVSWAACGYRVVFRTDFGAQSSGAAMFGAPIMTGVGVGMVVVAAATIVAAVRSLSGGVYSRAICAAAAAGSVSLTRGRVRHPFPSEDSLWYGGANPAWFKITMQGWPGLVGGTVVLILIGVPALWKLARHGDPETDQAAVEPRG